MAHRAQTKRWLEHSAIHGKLYFIRQTPLLTLISSVCSFFLSAAKCCFIYVHMPMWAVIVIYVFLFVFSGCVSVLVCVFVCLWVCVSTYPPGCWGQVQQMVRSDEFSRALQDILKWVLFLTQFTADQRTHTYRNTCFDEMNNNSDHVRWIAKGQSCNSFWMRKTSKRHLWKSIRRGQRSIQIFKEKVTIH